MRIVKSFAAPILVATAIAVAPNAIATNSSQLDQVDTIVDDYVKADWFTGTVALFQSDQLIYERSEGLADRERAIPNTTATKLRIGSINKHYTAALVLRLVQQGELSLDQPLSEFDLGFPQDIASKVTVRHLLSHRAGFEDLFTDEYRRNYQSLFTISDKLPLLMNTPLRFEPGTDTHYSNYGYIVLGAIVEHVMDMPFGAVLEQEILKPIGAKDTRYALTDAVENKALSYTLTHTGRKLDVTGRLENLTPDGGMYASAADLVKFYSALYYSDVLINDRMKAIMMSRYQEPNRSWSEILTDPESIRVGYGGGAGVSAAVELHLSDRMFIVVLANTDALVAERISQRITQVFRGEQPEAMKLPVALFAYRYLQSVDQEAFVTGLPEALNEAGYEDFSDRWLNRLAFELFDLGELEQSLAVLIVNNSLFPEEPNTHDSLGYLYEELGEPERALTFYRQALALDTEFSSAVEAVERLTQASSDK